MLTTCEGCSRHHMAHETACPFCGHTVEDRPSLAYRIATHPLVTATMLPLVLTACYGTGGNWKSDTEGWQGSDTDEYWTDADEDGAYQAEDCDDENPDVHPDADEICDNDIDDDCDELTDAEDPDCQDTGDVSEE